MKIYEKMARGTVRGLLGSWIAFACLVLACARAPESTVAQGSIMAPVDPHSDPVETLVREVERNRLDLIAESNRRISAHEAVIATIRADPAIKVFDGKGNRLRREVREEESAIRAEGRLIHTLGKDFLDW